MVHTKKRTINDAEDSPSPRTPRRKSLKDKTEAEDKVSRGQKKQNVLSEPTRRSRRLAHLAPATIPSLHTQRKLVDGGDDGATILQTATVRSPKVSSPPSKRVDRLSVDAEDATSYDSEIIVLSEGNNSVDAEDAISYDGEKKGLSEGHNSVAALSKKEGDENSDLSVSSGPNNKENELVTSIQTVSTTGCQIDPCEPSGITADLTISEGEVSKNTTNMQAVCKDQKHKNPNSINESERKAPVQEKRQEPKNAIRGLPVSGRWWKKEKNRFRTIFKDATGSKSWSKKMQIKKEREEVLAKSSAMLAAKERKRDELKERQKLNKMRREENAKKSEIIQVISDPRKLKKMKKKQLRYIETRDTTGIVKQTK